LIEVQTADRSGDVRNRIQWNGDRNFYQGFEVFWKVMRPGPQEDNALLSFGQWQAMWGERHEYLARSGAVHWRTFPTGGSPSSTQVPGEYALADDGDQNSPVGNASDGHDVGNLADLLPFVARSSPEISPADPANP
jgi:hypothetical protein